MLEPVKVGVLGLGTVGSGTVNVLMRNAQEIARRAGRGIVVTHASARDLDKARSCDLSNVTLTTQSIDIINNPDIQIIVELMGGTGLAKDLVLQAIASGKHVVTANKALIALHGNEIFEAAQQKGVIVAFEAAVAGGIPIIKAIREGLSGNQIRWLAGIINGTSNFILTEMWEKERDFADVLAEAQKLGYAEADPTFDIEGIDAAHKLTILASIAFGIPLQFNKVAVEGITGVTATDVNYAEELGYRIKLLGIAKRQANGVEMRVHPTLIPEKRLLANVNGVMNAIVVNGDAVGSTLHYGAGAGSEPTASSVVADLVDIVRTLTSDPENRVPHLAFQPDAIANIPVLALEEIETPYYLRMTALDRVGVLAQITSIFSQFSISIEALIQKEPPENVEKVTIVVLTHRVSEKSVNQAIAQIEQLEGIEGNVTRLRVETL